MSQSHSDRRTPVEACTKLERPQAEAADDTLAAFRRALAEDVRLIAALHETEVDAARIASLRSVAFPLGLALRWRKEASAKAHAFMADVLRAVPDDPSPEVLEELAVDFASIYLNYGLRAAPTESVWLDADHLERQGPMFAVRALYARRSLRVADWQKRADDHLVTELLFVAHLLGECADEAALREAALFLDRHLLRWIPLFADRVAGNCATPFYAGLALVTAAYLDELRDVLAEILGEARPLVEPAEPAAAPPVDPATLPVNSALTGPTW